MLVSKTRIYVFLEKRDQFTLRSSLKYATEPQYDTSEESLKEFIQNLDTATKMATAPAVTSQVTRKTKTPRTPTRSIVSSLDEIKEEDDAKSDATVSDDESFKSQCPTFPSPFFFPSTNWRILLSIYWLVLMY